MSRVVELVWERWIALRVMRAFDCSAAADAAQQQADAAAKAAEESRVAAEESAAAAKAAAEKAAAEKEAADAAAEAAEASLQAAIAAVEEATNALEAAKKAAAGGAKGTFWWMDRELEEVCVHNRHFRRLNKVINNMPLHLLFAGKEVHAKK